MKRLSNVTVAIVLVLPAVAQAQGGSTAISSPLIPDQSPLRPRSPGFLRLSGRWRHPSFVLVPPLPESSVGNSVGKVRAAFSGCRTARPRRATSTNTPTSLG
jgi:hypothetical protein